MKQLAFAALLAACGCKVGTDSMVFFTNTTIGVDLDRQPPNISVAYSRTELVIAPEYEEGKVPPVLATIRSEFLGFMSKQSFLTGHAAVIMARGMGKPDEIDPSWKAPKDDPLEIPLRPGQEVTPRTSYKEPYFFGTHTVFGFNVQVDPVSGLPSALEIGLRRKELAYVPILERLNDQKTMLTVQVPSLFAGASFESDSPTGKVSRIGNMQLFATGIAAEYLAGNHEVRESLLEKSLVGDSVAEVRKIQKEEAELGEKQTTLGKQIYKRFQELPPERKVAMRKRAVELKIAEGEDQRAFENGLFRPKHQDPDRAARMEQLKKEFQN